MTYEEGQNCIYEGKLYRALKESTGNLPTNSEYFEEAKFNSSNTYYSSNVVEYNNEWYYCLTENEDGVTNSSITDIEVWEKMDKEAYDLSYLFAGTLEEGKDGIIYPYPGSFNQLQTQYPSKEITARCAIMNDFGKYNADVIIMWGQVKAYTDMTPYYIILGVAAVTIVTYFVISIILKNKSTRNKRRLEKLTK